MNDSRRTPLWLPACYLALILACLIPASGIAFNSVTVIWGVPAAILWLTGCFLGFAVLSIVAYLKVFLPWCQDEHAADSDAVTDGRRG